MLGEALEKELKKKWITLPIMPSKKASRKQVLRKKKGHREKEKHHGQGLVKAGVKFVLSQEQREILNETDPD